MQIAFRTHDLGVKGLDNAIKKAGDCGISAVQLVAYKFMDEIKYVPEALNAENPAALSAPPIAAEFSAFKIGRAHV